MVSRTFAYGTYNEAFVEASPFAPVIRRHKSWPRFVISVRKKSNSSFSATEGATGVPREQATVVADDAAITEAVKAKLSQMPVYKKGNIQVSTKEGVVTLKGVVGLENTKALLGKIVKSVKGVKSVDNQIEVGQP